MSERFIKLEDGWIRDAEIGLEWWPESSEPMTWDDAQKWAKEQGGRLPTRKELYTLIDDDCQDNVVRLNKLGFGLQPDYYWSSTTYAYYTDYAWYVFLNIGYVFYDNKGNYCYCLAVRDVKEVKK